MNELGGYFELELARGAEFHKDALPFNSGRSAFRYLLRQQRPTKVYVPAFACDSLLNQQTLERVPFEFYHIDPSFEISILPALGPSERILYINYFDLKSDYANYLHEIYGDALILDGTQSFFRIAPEGVDTFYSARKFFGVPDGGYLYTSRKQGFPELTNDDSGGRFGHLLGRLGGEASFYYGEFLEAESDLDTEDIRSMSPLTKKILSSIDYNRIAILRQRNFFSCMLIWESVIEFLLCSLEILFRWYTRLTFGTHPFGIHYGPTRFTPPSIGLNLEIA